MKTGQHTPLSLQPRELEAVYAISQVVVEAEVVEAALDEIYPAHPACFHLR